MLSFESNQINPVVHKTRGNWFFLFLMSLFLLTFSSCLEDSTSSDGEYSAITEEVIYISGKSFRAVGRLLSVPSEGVSDHGFVFSQNEDFATEIIISLGAKSNVGRYVGESTDLERESIYYCKSYFTYGDNISYGNVLSFSTLSVSMTGFEPLVGKAGGTMIINGTNFLDNPKVYFGTSEARVISEQFESQIVVEIPPVSNEIFTEISITFDGLTVTNSEKFEYVHGKWKFVSELPVAGNLSEGFYYQIDDKFIYGLGKKQDFQLNSDIWTYDLNSESWTVDTFAGRLARTPIFSKGYFGGGINDYFSRSFSNEVWKYGAGGAEYIGEIPINIYKSVTFLKEDELIIIGGFSEPGENTTRNYSYNVSTNQLSELGPAFYEIESVFPSFSYEGRLFIVLKQFNQIWEYKPETNQWAIFADIPFKIGLYGMAEVINDKLYLGLFNISNAIWEMDLISHRWVEKSDYTESQGDFPIAHFVFEEKVYVFFQKFQRGEDSIPMEIWSFSPNQL